MTLFLYEKMQLDFLENSNLKSFFSCVNRSNLPGVLLDINGLRPRCGQLRVRALRQLQRQFSPSDNSIFRVYRRVLRVRSQEVNRQKHNLNTGSYIGVQKKVLPKFEITLKGTKQCSWQIMEIMTFACLRISPFDNKISKLEWKIKLFTARISWNKKKRELIIIF